MTKIFSTQEAKSYEGVPEFTPDVLGGKGFNLCKMAAKGIPVPTAYIIPTEYCREYRKDPVTTIEKVKGAVVPLILHDLKKEFGYAPLVSVRSGAKFSMPGMMDTILNVGLDGENFKGWEKRLGNKCAIDCYNRLIEMYGNVVHGIERSEFEGKAWIARKEVFEKHAKISFPLGEDQLVGAIEAVFQSWDNDRAKAYRKLNNIPDDLGTAVVVQAMVFGNFNEKSGTGVLFTRDFNTGVPGLIGDFVINGQGEDVVAGIVTPDPLSKVKEWNPAIYAELEQVAKSLERINRDMQDVEFTVQDGKLYLLQTRNGKRTAAAAVRIAVDLYNEKAITRDEALKRVKFNDVLLASRPVIDPAWLEANKPSFTGLPASNGIASGVAVFSSEDAVNCKEPCILITKETTPDDILGMNAAKGILTQTGGATSHAAVVARGMNRPCVVGATGLKVLKASASYGDVVSIPAGKLVTIDGTTGNVYVGVAAPVIDGNSNESVKKFIELATEGVDYYRVYTRVKDIEALEGKGTKYVFGTFELDRLGDGDAIYASLKTVAEKLSGQDVVFDLRGIYEVNHDPLVNVFCAEGETRNFLPSKLKALAEAKGKKGKFKLITSGLGKADQKLVAKLKAAGVVEIPTLYSLDDLVATEGLCLVDFDKLCTKNKPETVEQIIRLKRRAGQSIQSFNIVPEVDREDLKAGPVFALTPLALVRSLMGVE